MGMDMKKAMERRDSLEDEDILKGEYWIVKNLYDELHAFVLEYEAGLLGWVPKSPLELYKKRAKALGEALYAMELQAKIEDVNLDFC